MKPKEILSTIESYLELGHSTIPIVKESRKYLKDIGAEGATIRMQGERNAIILIKNKKDPYVLAEELTHFIDTENIGMGVYKETDVKNQKDFFYNQNCFYDRVLMEALGYYGSKIIAPKRKPISVRKRLEKGIAKKDWKSLRKAHTVNYKLQRAWHEIGYDLGEKVYNYVQRTGEKEPALLLVIKNRQEKKSFSIYKKILKQVTK